MSRVRGERVRAPTLIDRALLRSWPLPGVEGRLGKDGRGSVLVVGGGSQTPGAILLAGVAALRAGAGRLQLATAESVALSLAVALPEARVIGLPHSRAGALRAGVGQRLKRELAACDALLIGPGMSEGPAARELLRGLGRQQLHAGVVLDAGALPALREQKNLARRCPRGVVATPHAGEMAQLRGLERAEVLARPLAVAREAAQDLGVVIALKGAETWIVAPDGTAFHNTAGNAGLGTSGSGDTLAGVVAGLLARGTEPLQAAVWAVYLHALAGEVLAQRLAPLGFLARELLVELPPLLAAMAPLERRAGAKRARHPRR